MSMRFYFTILVLLFTPCLCVAARGVDIVSLSVSPAEVHTALGHPIDITVKVTNTSSTARYVGRAIVTYLEYAVKDATGHVLVPFSDPPAPPPTPYTGEDFIWLNPGQSFVLHQHVPLKSWGIKSAGRYTVVAFSNGTVATDAEWQQKKYGFFFAYAPQISVVVAGAK
jgi:hypothetical protein